MTQTDKNSGSSKEKSEIRQIHSPVAGRKVFEVTPVGSSSRKSAVSRPHHAKPAVRKPAASRKKMPTEPTNAAPSSKEEAVLPQKGSVDAAPENASVRRKHFRAKASTVHGNPVSVGSSARSEDPILKTSGWRGTSFLQNLNRHFKEFPERLSKGIPFYHANLLDDFEITRAHAQAIINSRHTSMSLRPFTQQQIRKVIEAFSDQALYVTALLNGELPEEVIQTFKQCGLHLFPEKNRDYIFRCDCASEHVICEHKAALILSIAQKFDEDPFSLLLMRGIEREPLFAALRRTRSGQVVEEKQKFKNNYELPISTIDFDNYYHPKGSLDDFEFNIAYQPNTLLRRLGKLEAWNAPVSIEEMIVPFASHVADLATHIAFDPPPEPEPDWRENRREKNKSLKVRPDKKRGSFDGDEFSDNERSSRQVGKKSNVPVYDEEMEPFEEEEIISKVANKKNAKDLPDENTPYYAIPFSQEILEMIPDAESISNTIVWAIRCHGDATARQLARRTRMKKPVVAQLLQGMLENHLVSQEGIGERAKFSTEDESLEKLLVK